MKRGKIFCLLLFLCCTFSSSIIAQGMYSDIQLFRVMRQLKSNDSLIVKGYNQLHEEAEKALKASSHALADFMIPGRYIDSLAHVQNSKSLQTDAFNAYVCALMYRLNGEKKYALKASELLNAWARKNKLFSEFDGSLVMAYSGAGLMNAALLMKNETLWEEKDKDLFRKWTENVYKKAGDSIRHRKNNWADWGRYASLLSASFLDDKDEITYNCNLIKSDISKKIAKDGSMPEEIVRGENGLWYTYFSLAPITASAWVIYNETGENLFEMDFDGASIKKALDYLLYYSINPDKWPHCKKVNKPVEGGWPYNLFEAMSKVYGDDNYAAYTRGKQPVIYRRHHFAWTFPTLMPPVLDAEGYEKLYVWLTPENPWKKTPEVHVNADELFKSISEEHPRLLVTKEQMQNVRESSRKDTLLQKYIREVIENADKYIDNPVQSNTRRCQDELLCLGFAYHYTGNFLYKNKAIDIIKYLCNNVVLWDWQHFLGAAEATMAVAFGYDIFYDALTFKERKNIRNSIIKNGLLPGMGAYDGAPYGWFTYVRHNWNIVCNSGMMTGALAIAKDDEDSDFYAKYIVPKAIESMSLAMNEYAPDGAYPEGPGYWGFATSHAVLGLEVLQNAIGHDYGLSDFEGFDKTFYYNWYMTAPNGNLISYADCYPDSKNNPNGLILWMAQQNNDAVLAGREHALLSLTGKKASVFDVLFYQAPQKVTPISTDCYFRGPVEVATMRTDWSENAVLASIKAGYNQVNHGHLDLGAFEYFALGEKWFYDLGSDNYYLPDFFDMNGERWQYFRTQTQSHNVPMIDDAEQNIYGKSHFSKSVMNKPVSIAEIDLTDVYSPYCDNMTRTLTMNKTDKTVIINDSYKLNKKVKEISWRGVTDAKVTLKNRRTAILEKNGKHVEVTIQSPSGAYFEIESAEQRKPQKKNEGVYILKAVKNKPSMNLDMRLLISVK